MYVLEQFCLVVDDCQREYIMIVVILCPKSINHVNRDRNSQARVSRGSDA